MRASELKDFIYNPAWTSEVLQHFLSGAMSSESSKLKTELLCLFPVIFDEDAVNILATANKTSSFYSLFEAQRNSNSKLVFVDLDKKILAFRNITREALICLGCKISVELGGFIQISDVVHYKNIKQLSMRRQCKAAFYWGSILAKEDYTTLLIKLGVTAL